MKHSLNQNNQFPFAPPRGSGGLHFFILWVMLFVFVTVEAQNEKQYLSFDLGGGIHSLSYDVPKGSVKSHYGYTATVGYSYFFSPGWGVGSGVGFRSLGATPTLNGLSGTPSVDADGDSYEFRNNFKDWKEDQRVLLLDVPLTVQYRHSISEKVGLLARVGGQVSIPVNSRYKVTNGEMVTTGYYSQWHAELSDLPQHGLSTYSNNFSGTMDLKVAYWGIADVGCTFKLSQQLNFYVGGYFDYGLNTITTPGTKQVYQPDGTYNGILSSDQVKEVKPIAFGLKVGIQWKGSGKRKR